MEVGAGAAVSAMTGGSLPGNGVLVINAVEVVVAVEPAVVTRSDDPGHSLVSTIERLLVLDAA